MTRIQSVNKMCLTDRNENDTNSKMFYPYTKIRGLVCVRVRDCQIYVNSLLCILMKNINLQKKNHKLRIYMRKKSLISYFVFRKNM